MLLFILNAVWFVLGGFFAGLGWILAGVIMPVETDAPVVRRRLLLDEGSASE